MKSTKRSFGVSVAVVLVTAFLSIGAHAGYHCNAPTTPEDKVACDLAKLDRPDELRLFIQRTAPIYGLYFYDYVSQQDFERWEVAQRKEATDTPAVAEARTVGRTSSDVPMVDVSLSHCVSAEGLDLNSSSGAAELEKRVNNAAQAACKQISRQYPNATPSDAECAKAAADKAMVRVHELLASAHKASGK